MRCEKINEQPVPSTSLKRAKTSSMKSCRGNATAIKCSAGPSAVRGTELVLSTIRVVVLVILQHRICDRRELVAIMNIAIQIHRHHFGPFLHVLLRSLRVLRRNLFLIYRSLSNNKIPCDALSRKRDGGIPFSRPNNGQNCQSSFITYYLRRRKGSKARAGIAIAKI